MASSNSSGSPSSSAVTIPIPGKSILKRPPPTQQSLFSRITRFLPTQNQAIATDEAKPLKRAHFILPQIITVYPISSANPPSTPGLKEEKRAIEDREAERRKKVVRGSALGPGVNDSEDWWTLDKVESFYRECCAGCDEQPDPAITVALKHASPNSPRSVDFSGVQLTLPSAAILSDVFMIEWGLRRLVFRECDLDENTLKPMLHALLIPNSLSFLSVASNRRLKAPAFRLLGAYVSEATTLQFLDLSRNVLDKKSVEYIVAALTTAPTPGLVSLRLDECSLRPSGLETLSRVVRTSSLRNISLRYNHITSTGAVALALMIRDYPDVVPGPMAPSLSSGTPSSSTASSPSSSVSNLLIPPAATGPSPSSPSIPGRSGAILPPPRHPTTNLQTTYTPYVPRARRGGRPPDPLSATGQHIPIITSSPQGGVTMRHPVPGSGAQSNSHEPSPRHDTGPSAALLDKVRALDALPRLGALRTLDLKGNDLRAGVTYIAQVLKRNRTLKVLNLSENKLDVTCLVTIAEALKYNSSLETLDLSKNPCSGPGLEGIQSLRTAFTLNTALKRLFLSSTSMSSAGAIALAEFLPESTSLLHLDLTLNNLDIAGVMALSSGLKANHIMRCLDLNIPPGDEKFARMCRDILNSCVRNTEEAERSVQAPNGAASGRGLGKGVWGMIEESELAKSIRLGEESKGDNTVILRAQACIVALRNFLSPPSQPPSPVEPTQPESPTDICDKAKTVLPDLTALIQETNSPDRMQELLGINDELMTLLAKMQGPSKPTLTLHGLGLGPGVVGGLSNGNGEAVHTNAGEGLLVPGGDDDSTPTTPRIDKGKGRAEPEPEEPEKVLSPTFLITESEDEDEDGHRYTDVEDVEELASPNDRSRSWVEEEGEVFRKGTVLLGPEEMEGEYAGEELRKELLEAMVERPPPRPLTDEFGMELPIMDQDQAPSSPTPNSLSEPPRRPYLSRSRSSSIMNIISPAMGPTSIPLPDSPVVESPTIAGLSSKSQGSPTIQTLLPRTSYLSRKHSISSEDLQ